MPPSNYVTCQPYNGTTEEPEDLGKDDLNALLYIVVTLLFYSMGIVIGIITYLKREQAEMEEDKMFDMYLEFKREPFNVHKKERVTQMALFLKQMEEQRVAREKVENWKLEQQQRQQQLLESGLQSGQRSSASISSLCDACLASACASGATPHEPLESEWVDGAHGPALLCSLTLGVCEPLLTPEGTHKVEAAPHTTGQSEHHAPDSGLENVPHITRTCRACGAVDVLPEPLAKSDRNQIDVNTDTKASGSGPALLDESSTQTAGKSLSEDIPPDPDRQFNYDEVKAVFQRYSMDDGSSFELPGGPSPRLQRPLAHSIPGDKRSIATISGQGIKMPRLTRQLTQDVDSPGIKENSFRYSLQTPLQNQQGNPLQTSDGAVDIPSSISGDSSDSRSSGAPTDATSLAVSESGCRRTSKSLDKIPPVNSSTSVQLPQQDAQNIGNSDKQQQQTSDDQQPEQPEDRPQNFQTSGEPRLLTRRANLLRPQIDQRQKSPTSPSTDAKPNFSSCIPVSTVKNSPPSTENNSKSGSPKTQNPKPRRDPLQGAENLEGVRNPLSRRGVVHSVDIFDIPKGPPSSSIDPSVRPKTQQNDLPEKRGYPRHPSRDNERRGALLFTQKSLHHIDENESKPSGSSSRGPSSRIDRPGLYRQESADSFLPRPQHSSPSSALHEDSPHPHSLNDFRTPISPNASASSSSSSGGSRSQNIGRGRRPTHPGRHKSIPRLSRSYTLDTSRPSQRK